MRILAFPCNQFGRQVRGWRRPVSLWGRGRGSTGCPHSRPPPCSPQEPGSNAEIKEFAAGYNVKFDMYSKVCVNGDDAHPLWKWMKVQPKGRGILGK